VTLLGEDVLNASEKQLRQWRGAKVAMIFQEPMTALNPHGALASRWWR
jgi:peptide/nickel transport system ATP-binding protein